jgi:hypothetical protein
MGNFRRELIINGGAVSRSGGAAFSPFSLAIFEAFTTPPTDERKVTIDTMVKALVAAGVWDVLDVLHVYAAADAQASRINWVDPGTYDGTSTAMPTFTADEGYTGNGTSSYVDSNFNPQMAVGANHVATAGHVAAWVLTGVDGEPVMGYDGNDQSTNIYSNFGGSVFLRVNDNPQTGGFATTGNTGFFLGNRSSATGRQGYKNGVSVGAYGSSPNLDPISDANIATHRNVDIFGTAQVSMLSIGGSLTAQQASDFYDAALAYMQAVGAVP